MKDSLHSIIVKTVLYCINIIWLQEMLIQIISSKYVNVGSIEKYSFILPTIWGTNQNYFSLPSPEPPHTVPLVAKLELVASQ